METDVVTRVQTRPGASTHTAFCAHSVNALDISQIRDAAVRKEAMKTPG